MQDTRLPEGTQEKLPATDRAMVRYLREGLVHGYRTLSDVINALTSDDEEAKRAAVMALVVVGTTFAQAVDGVDYYLDGNETELPAKYFEEPVEVSAPTKGSLLFVPGNGSIN